MSSNPEVRTVRATSFVLPLITASGVLAALIVQRIVRGIVDLLGALLYGSISSVWQFSAFQSVWLDIFFAAGVFLVLWLIRPIGAGLRLFPIVIRTILASAGGAVLVFVAILIIGVYNAIGGLLGLQTGFQLSVASRALGSGIWSGGGYLVDSTPLVILAGILLWMWLARHPGDTRVKEDGVQV